MVEQLSSPLANSVTLTLLHFLWQGFLIGLIYWALLATTDIRSARIRYATSLLALSVMALCPMATFVVLYGSASTINATPVPVVAASPAEPLGLASDPIPSEDTGNRLWREIANEDASNADPVRAGRGSFAAIRAAVQSLQPYVLLLWLAGVTLSASRLTAGLLNVAWLRYGRTAIPTELMDRSLVLARRLGSTTVRICASARIRQAAVVGFWKPVILLPVSWLTLLPTDVLEAVIAHEIAHLRRFDVWVNLLQRILETLLFYHPMVWWLSNQIRLERELCCDELAVQATGERGNYVVALEQVGRLQVHGNVSLSPAFTGDPKMNLLSRIHYLLGTDNRKPERGLAWLVGLMVVAIPLVLIGLDGHFAGRNAVAQDREDGRSVEAKGRPQAAEREAKQRSPEAVAERRRSPEAEAKRRRSPEAEVGPSRSAEGDRGPSRSAEGAGRRDRTNPLQRFKPQTEREAALYQMILQLQREVDQLRQAIGQPSADKSGEGRESVGQRDGKIPPLTAGWERTKAGNVFRAYDKNGDAFVALDEWLAMTNGNINAARRELQTQRFRATRPGSDDKLSPAEFIYWWNHREGAQRGRRDGDRAKRGPRDAEGRRSVEAEAGPRRSPEEEAGPRRSPEEEAGPRGSAESDSGANRDSGDGA